MLPAITLARRALVLPVLAAALVPAGISQAAIIYVDDSAVGLDTGESWEHAFRRLRPALLAAHAGDEVRVAQGTHCPAQPGESRDLAFILPAEASVVGGFAGFGAIDPDDFDPETYITVLTGDINGDDGPDFANYADNSRHVVIAAGGRNTVLRGMTISGGNADGLEPNGMVVGGVGGAIAAVEGSAPSILECTLELNQAHHGGGAIHAALAQPLLRRCLIQNNQSIGEFAFGGACVLGDGSRVERCDFIGNASSRSAGALIGAGIKITHCNFESNTAVDFGGAVVGNDLTFDGCAFTDNSAAHGGAMRCANVTINNCTFEDNTSEGRGGAIVAAGFVKLADTIFTLNQARTGGAIEMRGVLEVQTCTFDRNTTGENGLDGGAIAARGLATVVNCRFLANVAGRAGGAIALDDGAAVAVNCGLLGNRARRVGGAIVNDHASFQLSQCAIVGNRTDGVGGHAGGAVHNRHAGTLRIGNSILWNNFADAGPAQQAQLLHEDGTLIIAHSLVQGWDGVHGGVGNGGDDPLFQDADGPDDTFGTGDDDLRLQAGSPARDAGDRALLPRDLLDVDHDGRITEKTPLDLLGSRRVRGGAVDIGPVEFGGL